MQHAYFFGYGSLVNRGTHHFEGAHPATLKGWRRVWRHTKLREAAFLTIVRDDDCTIDGLVAEVPEADWAALDRREAAYDRVMVMDQVTHPMPHRPDVAVYAIAQDKHGRPETAGPVLLSYIDVVVQGYLREHGEAGVERFFDTTHGWDAPVLNDRHDPRYARHQPLTLHERALTDWHLARLCVPLFNAGKTRPTHDIP